MSILNRSTMALLSDPGCHYSQRVRIVLAEKGVTCDIEDYTPETVPAELADLNPYNSLPTLVDRDLVLYDSRVMMEYLDERFPHPPLLPVYPVARAQARLWMQRIEHDWCPAVDRLMLGKGSAEDAKMLGQSLTGIAPIFGEMPFFMSEDFTLTDCCLAPILWRLNQMGVSISKSRQTKPLYDYMGRLFTRDSFKESLSIQEKEMASPV
tara:strand:- start:222 stop:848 length:627 start_codon:yes stop_codon:yes gene_type:complete